MFCGPFAPYCVVGPHLKAFISLQEVKGKTAQMDADLAAKQAALEAQEQARDIARDQAQAIDTRVATLSERPQRCQPGGSQPVAVSKLLSSCWSGR
jgi:hypothetical protein